MGRLFVFTAGTSMIENLLRSDTGRPFFRHIQNNFEKFSALDKWPECPGGGWKGDPPDPQTRVIRPERAGAVWALDYYDRKDPLNKNDEPTAEMSSFARLDFDTERDQIVLLASDTPIGVLCAILNAHLMLAPDGAVVHWSAPGREIQRINWYASRGSEPSQSAQLDRSPRALIRAREVAVLRVPKLKPQTRSGFEKDAVANLTRLIALLNLQARGMQPKKELVLIFTGGFKASLPVLTQAAGWLGGVQMWGLHESGDELLRIAVFSSAIDAELEKIVAAFAWLRGSNKHILEKLYGKSSLEKIIRDNNLPNPHLLPQEARVLFDSIGEGKLEFSLLGDAVYGILLSKYVPSLPGDNRVNV